MQVKARSTSKGLCESVASKATKDAEVPRKVEVASNLTRKVLYLACFSFVHPISFLLSMYVDNVKSCMTSDIF